MFSFIDITKRAIKNFILIIFLYKFSMHVMVNIKEFRGLRPKDPVTFSTKPYDVIDEEEASLLRKNKNSAIHIILPRGDKDKYNNAKKAFDELKPVMIKDEPSIYLYEEKSDEFQHRGFIFCVSLKDYENGLVKKHELTREKPLKDRVKHIEHLKANTGLVWTTFKKNDKLKSIMNTISKDKPVFDFQKFGYRHRLWKIDEHSKISEIKEEFRTAPLYIADGHHRISAAWHYWKKEGYENASYVMVFAASDDEVRILPYNRVIKKIDDNSFLESLKKEFHVQQLTELREPQKHEIQMYFKNQWWQLIPKGIPENSVDTLDVSILQNKIFKPLLNITDIRTDPNVAFIGGIKTREEYEKLGEIKGFDAVFYLCATKIEELEDIADLNQNMPPKSTWFDPKLLTGLVFHEFS
jgi:uncharacterized protein (DUF1015 family)